LEINKREVSDAAWERTVRFGGENALTLGTPAA
jgi:hypothetical protein